MLTISCLLRGRGLPSDGGLSSERGGLPTEKGLPSNDIVGLQIPFNCELTNAYEDNTFPILGMWARKMLTGLAQGLSLGQWKNLAT